MQVVLFPTFSIIMNLVVFESRVISLPTDPSYIKLLGPTPPLARQGVRTRRVIILRLFHRSTSSRDLFSV